MTPVYALWPLSRVCQRPQGQKLYPVACLSDHLSSDRSATTSLCLKLAFVALPLAVNSIGAHL